MNRLPLLSLATLALSALIAGMGCSRQVTPTHLGQVQTDHVGQRQMDEAPVSESSPEADAALPPSEPFPPAITWDHDSTSCADGERQLSVYGGDGPYHVCTPTVEQRELGESREETVLVEAPVFTKYARRTGLKSGWDSPGIALLQPDGTLVPLTREGKFLLCGGRPRRDAADAPRCPAEGAARILGSVTRHEFPGRPVPDLTFELLAAEPANTLTKSPLPVVPLLSQARSLPLAASCSDWKKCNAGEVCVHWDDRSAPSCVPEIASLDAVTAAHHSKVVVLRHAPASIETKARTRDCDSPQADTLVLTRKKGSVTVTRPTILGLSSPVECGAATPSPSLAGCPLDQENEQVVGVIRPLGSRAAGAPDLEFELLARGVQFAHESARIRQQRVKTCTTACEGKAVCVHDPDTRDDSCIAPSSMDGLVHARGDDVLLVVTPVVEPAPHPGGCTEATCWPVATLVGPQGERVPMEAKVTGRRARAPLRCTPKPGRPSEWDCPGAGAARLYGHVRPRSAPLGEPEVVFELLGIDRGKASAEPAGSTPAATPPAAIDKPAAATTSPRQKPGGAGQPAPSNSSETAGTAPQSGVK